MELSGDIKWQLPTLSLLQSILQLVFFSFCFIFSAQMEKCIRQSSSHLDPSAPHRDVTQLPACSQPLPQRDPLIPRAFLFISCLSWRQKYWVLVSLSDFKAGRKGSFVRTERSAPVRTGAGGLVRNFCGLGQAVRCYNLPRVDLVYALSPPCPPSWSEVGQPSLHSMKWGSPQWLVGSPRTHPMLLCFRPRGIIWGRR